MTVLDWIVSILLVLAAVRGWRAGFFVQLGGIVAVILAVWLAFRYAGTVGRWLKLDDLFATTVGFLIIFLLVLVAGGMVGRILRGVFRFAGLGILDRFAGLVAGVLKMTLCLSALLWIITPVNGLKHWISPETLDRSLLYKPVCQVAPLAFPYLVQLWDTVRSDGPIFKDNDE